VLSLIVAVADNGVIGRGGALPWHLPDDLAHFRRTTLGKPVIMGRRTFVSIGRPLPGRQNVVLSRDPEFRARGCLVARNLDEALGLHSTAPEQIVIGGASLYEEALPRAQRIYLTRVHASPPGDVYFPKLDPGEWGESLVSRHESDARHAHAFSIYLLVRR
jgi:dihydrofolate reductase